MCIRDRYLGLLIFTLSPNSLLNPLFVAYLIPVSYTHLDVYKRQVSVWVSKYVAKSKRGLPFLDRNLRNGQSYQLQTCSASSALFALSN